MFVLPGHLHTGLYTLSAWPHTQVRVQQGPRWTHMDRPSGKRHLAKARQQGAQQVLGNGEGFLPEVLLSCMVLKRFTGAVCSRPGWPSGEFFCFCFLF